MPACCSDLIRRCGDTFPRGEGGAAFALHCFFRQLRLRRTPNLPLWGRCRRRMR
nr:MAG TPA: hypothetical protein [Caudoviricetes sp.]